MLVALCLLQGLQSTPVLGWMLPCDSTVDRSGPGRPPRDRPAGGPVRHLHQRHDVPADPESRRHLARATGCTVEFPMAQTCCGQMFTNTGYFDEALPTVRAYVDAFAGYDYVVGPRVVHRFGPGAAPDARGPPGRHRARGAGRQGRGGVMADLSEFLCRRAQGDRRGPTSRTGSPTTPPATRSGSRRWATGCQPPPGGAGHRPGPAGGADQCCGFGGTFSVKNPDVSVRWAPTRRAASWTPARELPRCRDNSCLMHVGGLLHRMRSGVKPIHLADLAQTGGGCR